MALKKLRKGIFITFEGPEGCGKTTQSKLLYDYLRNGPRGCAYTREPGGTKVGELVRKVILHSKDINMTSATELFLFEACRSQIVEEVISPALAKGKIVICDRYKDATLAYQGYAGGIGLELIRSLNDIATGSLEPDLTILLDVETSTGLKRAKSKGADRMEKKDVAYHRKVRSGYLTLAGLYPNRIKVIKVRDTIDKTQKLVRQEVGRVI